MNRSIDGNRLVPEGGTRRFLTLLFADLCESSQLATIVDAEHFADMLRRLRAAARVAIARHGGLIARIQGDGVVAVFGHPEAAEDDARRAVEAALDLREAINAIEVAGQRGAASRIGLHSGIHAGLVFVEEGDIERGRLDLVGHTVNTAARLCSLARDGEVWVSESALGAYRNFFESTGTHELAIKGQAEPVPIRTIVRRAATVERRFEASAIQGLSDFVGREVAWYELLSTWRGVQQDRRGAGLLLTGQPGLGKTRLMEEFARHEGAHGFVLRGHCESYLAAEALQPFLQILRAHDAASETGADPMAIVSWFQARTKQRPTLLMLDDWQWADDASRQVLDRLLALELPLFMVIASRTATAAALDGRRIKRLELAPLDDEATARVIGQRLQSRDPFVAREIHAYAGGIPLFVEELCHAHSAGASILAGVPQSGTAWLSTLVASRLTRLDERLAALVRLASVIGRSFSLRLLQASADPAPDDAALGALAQEDFVFPAERPGTLRFKHGITRDAVYATVGLAERQRLHARVAAELQRNGDLAEGPPEALAYHLSAAGDHERAAAQAERAGDRAMKAHALDRAREQYAAALHDLDRLDTLEDANLRHWCRVAQKLGMACVFDPISIPDREALLDRAVTLARRLDDANARARAHYWLGYARYAVGRAQQGLTNCEQALALAQASGDERLAAQVRATLGQALTAVCRYDEALPLLDDAIGTKRRNASPGGSVAIGSAYALACKGLLLADRARFGPSREAFLEARGLLAGSTHPVAASVCGLMGISLLWEGAWDEARAAGMEGAAVADASRSRQLLAMGLAIAGFARWRGAQDEAGVAAVRESVQWIEARGGLFMVSLLYGWLLEAAAARGDWPSARRDAARLLRRARAGDRIGEAMGCRAMGRLYRARGQLGLAEQWLQRAHRSAAYRSSPHEAAQNEELAARWRAGSEEGAPTPPRPLKSAC